MNNIDLLKNLNNPDFQKIKQLLLNSNKMVKTVPFQVENYKQVVNLWIQYKNDCVKITDYEIKTVFDFHKLDIDHVILYHSFGKETTLLMCKIREKYKNVIISNDEISKIKVFNNLKTNIIATYC